MPDCGRRDTMPNIGDKANRLIQVDVREYLQNKDKHPGLLDLTNIKRNRGPCFRKKPEPAGEANVDT